MYLKIKDVEHLKELCNKSNSRYRNDKTDDYGGIECFINIGGFARSSKTITWNGNTFWIYHDIDDTDETVDEKALMKQTNIGTALDSGNLYMY